MANFKNSTRASAKMPEGSLVDLVREIVKSQLLTGNPDLPTVAGKAGFPVRTLQRRLASSGVTFSDLATDIKINLARELLGDRSRSIDEIASMLGYTDPANFTRAFKNRTGMTPTQFRKSVNGNLSV